MNVEAACGCGARISLAPGSPSTLGNAHGYAVNNNATVDAEREAVAAAFAIWVEAHQKCAQPPLPAPLSMWPEGTVLCGASTDAMPSQGTNQ